MVKVFERIAATTGEPLVPGCEVLDFGAGAGRHVVEFLEHGYAALGVDQQFSSAEAGRVEAEHLRTVSPPDYVLPFGEASFDFVYSTSVMEHVVNPGQALAEIARVLRPGGLSVHIFPSRWRPVEPHVFVPFGGRIHNYAWFRLWAALGIRNRYQKESAADAVALTNVQYARTGISYPTAREWLDIAKQGGFDAEWAERPYIEATAELSGLSRRLAPIAGLPGLVKAYRGLHTRVLVLRH